MAPETDVPETPTAYPLAPAIFVRTLRLIDPWLPERGQYPVACVRSIAFDDDEPINAACMSITTSPIDGMTAHLEIPVDLLTVSGDYAHGTADFRIDGRAVLTPLRKDEHEAVLDPVLYFDSHGERTEGREGAALAYLDIFIADIRVVKA